jgi:hypothetical protein
MDDRETQRGGYSLTIPGTLLQSDAMLRACATRNFQEIFRLVNRRTGSSHAVMAAAVGKMTSSRVSDVIRGVRRIRGQEVIERVADGFGIPGELLGLPKRPWEGSPEKDTHQPESPACSDPSKQAVDIGSGDPQGSDETPTVAHPDVLLISVWIEGRKQIVPVSRRDLITGAIGAAL